MWSSPLPFGAASVVLGAVYMYAAGAPSRYIVVNFGALVAGCLAAWLIGRRQTHNQHVPAAFTIAVAVTLLATALFAPRVSGASRWIPAAGISVQPSLMLLPAA